MPRSNTTETRLKNMVWFYYGRWITLDLWLCRDLWKHATSPQVYRATPNKQLLLHKPHFSMFSDPKWLLSQMTWLFTMYTIMTLCTKKENKRKLTALNNYLGKITNKAALSYYNGQTLGRPFPDSFFPHMLLQHLETHCTSIAHCKLH